MVPKSLVHGHKRIRLTLGGIEQRITIEIQLRALMRRLRSMLKSRITNCGGRVLSRNARVRCCAASDIELESPFTGTRVTARNGVFAEALGRTGDQRFE